MAKRNIFVRKPDKTHEDFIRELIVKLSSEESTPTDVLDADFGEVTETFRDILGISAHVETDFTCSIGYDRYEEYWDKERKYNSSTQSYYYEDVKRTRKVTDWQPYSGHTSGDAMGYAFNEHQANTNNYLYENSEIESMMVKSNKDDFIDSGEEVDINEEAFERTKDYCEFNVRLHTDLPGDDHRDWDGKSDVDVKGIWLFRLPYYNLTFTHKGQNYSASAASFGELVVKTELPQDSTNTKAIIAEGIKKNKIMMIAGWVTLGVLFVLSSILTVVAYQLTVLWTLLVFVGFGLGVLFTVLFFKKKRAVTNEIKNNRKTKKINKCKALLSAKGLAPLTNDELALFK